MKDQWLSETYNKVEQGSFEVELYTEENCFANSQLNANFEPRLTDFFTYRFSRDPYEIINELSIAQ